MFILDKKSNNNNNNNNNDNLFGKATPLHRGHRRVGVNLRCVQSSCMTNKLKYIGIIGSSLKVQYKNNTFIKMLIIKWSAPADPPRTPA